MMYIRGSSRACIDIIAYQYIVKVQQSRYGFVSVAEWMFEWEASLFNNYFMLKKDKQER